MNAKNYIDQLLFILIIFCVACEKDKFITAPKNAIDENTINTATLIVNENCESINTYQNSLQFNAESNLLIIPNLAQNVA